MVIYLLVLLFLFSPLAEPSALYDKAKMVLVDSIPDLIGERLEYSVSLKRIPVGRQILGFDEILDHQGRSVFAVSFIGYPNLMLKALNYTNKEIYYLDEETLLPLFTSRSYSGGFSSGKMETFFHEEDGVIEVQVTEKEKRVFRVAVEEPFQGETTLILFSRFADLEKEPLIEVFSGSGTQYLRLLKGKKEEVTIPYGTFPAEVVLIEPGIGKVWLSQDEYRVPLKVILETNMGELELRLMSIQR